MKIDDQEAKLRYVDSGWAWISLLASFCGNFLVGFVSYSTGIFHMAFLDVFKQGNAKTSVVGAVFNSILCLMGPFIGTFINATSCRVSMALGGLLMLFGFSVAFFAENLSIVIVAYSLIAGAGSGFCCVTPVVMVGYSFKKFLGLAVGVVAAAGGCGMLGSGPLAQYLLDEYGLHGAFLMMGAISSHCIIAGFLMRPSGPETCHKYERTLMKENAKGVCENFRHIVDADILKNKSMLMIFLATILWNSAYAVIFLYLPNFSVVKGFDKFKASFLILEIGLGSALSRIFSGLAAGKESGLDPLLLKMGVLGVVGLLTLLFPLYSTHFWQQSVFAVLFGVYSGGIIAFMVPVCLEIVGLAKLASAMGMMYFAGGIGTITGPPVVGFIIDRTGSYETCFYYSGAFLTAGAFCVLFSTLCRPKDVEKKPTDAINAEIVLKGSSILAGSGFLTGSLHILFETQQMAMSVTDQSLLQQSISRNTNTDEREQEFVPLKSVCENR